MPVIPETVLNDLRLRFLFITRNKGNPMALCSNIEAARLFYLEHHWPQDSTESEPDLKDFIRIFFSEIPSLKHYLEELEQVLNEYVKYKEKTPNYGGLILNKQKNQVLLVRDSLTKAWDFPKGKISDHSPTTFPTSRIIKQETGLVISRERWLGRIFSDMVASDEAFTFLEVIDLSDEEIDPKMLRKSTKWFTMDELEAWENDEVEKTSYARVGCFLPRIKLLFSKDTRK